MPLTEGDRKLLVEYARSVLERSVRGLPARVPENPPASVLVPTGAFVTLRQSNGRLRGCMGRITASQPLIQTIADCTVEAASRDPRFKPVTPQELPGLYVEISVLSPMEEVRSEDVEVGRHGLLISVGLRHGLLLPQVADEWGWDRERFLDETCLKAGLPRNAWRQGARIQAFTAEVFGETPSPQAELAPSGLRSGAGMGSD